MGRRDERKYREIFFAWNGPGPYECSFCKELVDFWDVVIHHINHDENDHRLVNMASCHRGCHTNHHSTGRGVGKKASREARAKMSESHRKRWASMSQEERSAIGLKSASNRDSSAILKKSWETRRKNQEETSLDLSWIPKLKDL